MARHEVVRGLSDPARQLRRAERERAGDDQRHRGDSRAVAEFEQPLVSLSWVAGGRR